MQYPGTVDKWYDHSGIQVPTPVDVSPRPLFLTAAAFDRGPEKITRVYGEDFYKLYGYSIDFAKYGQAAIQAANIIDNGGELMVKRVVAKDATLANAVIVAHITPAQTQKTDNAGKPLYIDPVTQQETTDPGENNERAMINVAKIKYDVVTIPEKGTIAEIVEEAGKLLSEDTGSLTYPLFVITDNGRGVSTKRVGFEPLYSVSKNLSHMLYRIKYLGSENLDAEYGTFAVTPGVIYLDESRDIGMAGASMLQIDAVSLESNIDKMYAKIAEISGLTVDSLNKIDVLFGRDNKGAVVPSISIDETGYDLSVTLGFPLMSGTNGSFGERPIETDAYEAALVEFYDGTYDSDIFNLDLYKPDVCVDANYPYAVKNAIIELARFRKDFYFFADLGLDCNTYENAINAYYDVPKDKFVGWYGQAYQVINPFNKRYIDVTITYSIARLLVEHLTQRTNAPYCGIMHNWIIPEAIEGTINFTPKITPTVNQKQVLGDMGLNYASVLNGALTLETEYTSQEVNTQLSFINNVIAIQYIIKDIRNNCPKYRYSFISSNDLTQYKKNVSEIINKYNSWFEILEFVYVQDEIMKANKIFEASINIKHKDFVQSEIFNIYTLGTEDSTLETTNTSVVASN